MRDAPNPPRRRWPSTRRDDPARLPLRPSTPQQDCRYPADPPTVEEIIAVMRTAGTGTEGARLRALIVVLWRAGLRTSEALALAATDMDARRGAWQHAHLGVTSIYQGIDNSEIIDTVHARRPPMIPATAGLRTIP
jgi:integrase